MNIQTILISMKHNKTRGSLHTLQLAVDYTDRDKYISETLQVLVHICGYVC